MHDAMEKFRANGAASARYARLAALIVGSVMMSGFSVSNSDAPIDLPFDTPVVVEGVETVCTGIGQDSRSDPRWNAYPLKVVLAGEGGQYLGEARLNVAVEGESMMDVRCRGPWVLFKLDPGRYVVTATINGNTVKSTAYVAEGRQGRVILRFPAVGGAISPEHEPATE
jgi:hypothetical protein